MMCIYGLQGVQLVKIFLEHYKALHVFAAQILRNTELAEDVLQDAYIRLARIKVLPKGPENFIYTTVQNLALNRMRNKKKFVFNSRRCVPLEDGPELSDESDPEAGLSKLQAVRQLHKAVERLPNKSYSLFVALLQDSTLSEYAATHNLNRNSMGPHYNYGLKILRLEMGVA